MLKKAHYTHFGKLSKFAKVCQSFFYKYLILVNFFNLYMFEKQYVKLF